MATDVFESREKTMTPPSKFLAQWAVDDVSTVATPGVCGVTGAARDPPLFSNVGRIKPQSKNGKKRPRVGQKRG
jgi:hypothetical protein